MSKIVAHKEPPIGWVIFNRPEVLNAFDFDMWRELPEVVSRLDRDPDVEIIIMRGEGGVFGAGADIKEMLDYVKSGISQTYAEAVNRCFRGLSRTEKITIAAVERYALGGGCMIALACDLRVVGKGAKVGIPLVKLGLAVEPLGIKRLLEVCGTSFALEFLLTGEPIPMEKLIYSGIANFVVEDHQVVQFSKELALKLLDNGHFALKTTKRIVKEFTKGEPDWKLLNRAFASCMDTQDFVERAERFIKKH